MGEKEEEEIDFEIVKEPWNKYKLEDGTILRLKNPVIKAFRLNKPDQFGLPTYRFGGQTLISALVPRELMGTPANVEKIEPSDISTELKFEVVGEDWCEYKLVDGAVLKTKTVVTKIFKTKKFNNFGEPVYWCSWQVLTDKSKPEK